MLVVDYYSHCDQQETHSQTDLVHVEFCSRLVHRRVVTPAVNSLLQIGMAITLVLYVVIFVQEMLVLKIQRGKLKMRRKMKMRKNKMTPASRLVWIN